MEVWGKNDYFLGRSMDVFMSKLRKYLRADQQILLETIHGMGYRFTVPVVWFLLAGFLSTIKSR